MDNNFENKELTRLPVKTHKCIEPDCKAAFSRPYRLKNHIETHHKNKKPFKCPFEGCGKQYSSQAHLQRHKIITHIGEVDRTKEVVCNVKDCRVICANKYSLKKHLARAHVEMPFRCQICNAKFRRKSQLAVHKVETHDKSAPYKCDRCSLSFVHLHLFNRHKSRHRTYNCDCDETFDKWSEYLKHKKSDCAKLQSQHPCAICDKTFQSRQNLARHVVNVHVRNSNSEQFVCGYLDCNRSYKYKKNLSFHIETYHKKNVQYFNCSEENCRAVLKTKRNFRRHLKSCHTNKKLRNKDRRKAKRSKMSTASKLSGIKVSYQENVKNIKGQLIDETLKAALQSNDEPLSQKKKEDIIKQAILNSKRTIKVVLEKIDEAKNSMECPNSASLEQTADIINIMDNLLDHTEAAVPNKEPTNDFLEAVSFDNLPADVIIFEFPELENFVNSNAKEKEATSEN